MAGPSKPKPQPAPSPSYRLALADLVATTLWVLISSLFGEVAETLSKLSGVDELLVVTAVVIGALVAFGPVCTALGSLLAGGTDGAIFNPVHNVALAVGKGEVRVNILRALGQLFGAVLGSFVAIKLVPTHLQGKFHTLSGGVKEGVAFELGVACEGLLSLVLNIVFLTSLGSKSKVLAVYTPLALNVALILVGAHFTGPSLNPFISFGWHLFYRQHSAAEHLLVFWAAPFAGALLAGLAVRAWDWAVAVTSAVPPGAHARRSGGGRRRVPKGPAVPPSAAAAAAKHKTQ